MGRLKTLAPRIAALPNRLGHAQGDKASTEQERDKRRPYRAWYKTKRWQDLRQRILVRDLYTCAMCGLVSAHGMIADHKRPHRGNEALFWDETNIQVLCPPCHSRQKQKLDQATPMGVWD